MSKRLSIVVMLVAALLILSACAPTGVDESVVNDLEAQLAEAQAALENAADEADLEALEAQLAEAQAALDDAMEEAEAAAAETEEPMEEEDMGPIDLEFRLNWTLYGEHAPFFVGVEKGFYADEGLNVTVVEGSGSSTTVKLVGNGTNLIGYADSATMMRGVSAGVPVKAVGVLLQTSPMSFIYRGDAERPTTLDELPGTKVAITAGDASLSIFEACLGKNGLTTDDVELVVVSNPAAKETAMLEGTADTFLGYYIDQPMRMEKNTGIEINWTTLYDLCGVNTLSSAIIVSDRTLDEQPELVRKFVRATQRAVEYTMANPEEAATIFAAAAADFGFDEELSLREINGALELLYTENSSGQPIGWSSIDDWTATQELLQEFAGFNPEADVNVFFTNDFLSDPPYEPGE